MTISKAILDELLKAGDRPEDLLGDTGSIGELKVELMQRTLGGEPTAHIGYEDGNGAPAGQSNGTSTKMMKPPHFTLGYRLPSVGHLLTKTKQIGIKRNNK